MAATLKIPDKHSQILKLLASYSHALSNSRVTLRIALAGHVRSAYRSGVAFNRLRRSKGEAFQTYATTANVVPGPFAEWPRVAPDAAALHEQQYNEQRERLNAMLVDQGKVDEIFVAKVFAVMRPDGGSHTYTTWTEGVHTLLPAADVILLVEQPAEADSRPPMSSHPSRVGGPAHTDETVGIGHRHEMVRAGPLLRPPWPVQVPVAAGLGGDRSDPPCHAAIRAVPKVRNSPASGPSARVRSRVDGWGSR